jgi:hypothetical protein
MFVRWNKTSDSYCSFYLSLRDLFPDINNSTRSVNFWVIVQNYLTDRRLCSIETATCIFKVKMKKAGSSEIPQIHNFSMYYR